jgi:hypothetical protein
MRGGCRARIYACNRPRFANLPKMLNPDTKLLKKYFSYLPKILRTYMPNSRRCSESSSVRPTCRPGSVVSIVRGTDMMAALGAMAGRGPAPSHHKHKAVGRPSRGGPPDRDTYTLSRGRQLQKDGDLGTTDDQNCTAATAGARHPSIDEPSAADRAGGQCASSASGPEHRDWCGRRRPYRAGRDLDGSRPATGRPVLRKLLLGEEIGEHAAVPTC